MHYGVCLQAGQAEQTLYVPARVVCAVSAMHDPAVDMRRQAEQHTVGLTVEWKLKLVSQAGRQVCLLSARFLCNILAWNFE
jgi:hypothetical protein